jgi:hypothetical protein
MVLLILVAVLVVAIMLTLITGWIWPSIPSSEGFLGDLLGRP